jgi:hypothetical protein
LVGAARYSLTYAIYHFQATVVNKNDGK